MCNRYTRIRVLTIAVPALDRGEYGFVQTDLGTKYLILILTTECLLKSTQFLDRLAMHHDARRDCRFILQKEMEELRRRDQGVGRNAQAFNMISFLILDPTRPAIPP